MRLKKMLVGVTLITFLGSDFTVGIAPALGQSPSTGDGRVPMPSLSGDGTFGRVLPGLGTTTPYLGVPQPPQQEEQQTQPRYFQQRPAAPFTANLCQPGGGGRFYQTVTVPRTRSLQPAVPGFQPQQAPATTVTQVAATSQSGAPQATQSPTETSRFATVPTAGTQEIEELSRIEAAFNLDPIRQMSILDPIRQASVPIAPQQQYFGQPVNLQQPGVQQQQATFLQAGLQQQQGAQQQPGSQPQPGAQQQQQQMQQPQQVQQPQLIPEGPAMLGPFGTPLRQYGYSMFAANVSTFAPVDDIPVGPDYVMGPGDDVTINVWGAVDSTLVRTVDRNGRIVLPKVGDLRIWGLTFAQADRLIRDELARYFRGFQTSVTMGRLRTVNVYVVGEVCQPGVYTLSALSTVTNGLFSAGGPTKLGSLREVRLIRGGYQVARLDLYDFLQRGDRTRDYRLESGG